MIDTSFLLSFQKHFPKETGELKFILNLVNDLYVHFNYFKDSIISRDKIFQTFGSNLLVTNQLISNEFNEFKEEDLSNWKDLESILLDVVEKLGNLFTEDCHINLELEKSTYTLNDEINLITKGLNQNTTQAFTHLTNSRLKLKNQVSYLEKLNSQLEQIVLNKRKSENDKNTYNVTIKQKYEEKILQIFHEMEDKNLGLKKAEKETRHLETFLHIIIESTTKNVISFCSNGFKSLRKSFSDIGSKKLTVFHSIKQMLTEYLNKLKEMSLDLDTNIEKVYAEKMQLNNFGNNLLQITKYNSY